MHSITRSSAAVPLLAIALAVTTLIQTQTATGAAAPTPVEVTRPVTGEVYRWVTLPGSIKPLQEAMLYAKVPGYLQSINVDKGDSVRSGAILAVLETPELSADLTRFRAEVDAARSEYERLQKAIDQAPDLIMPVELDRAKGKFDVAQANLERTQSLLGFNKITAPFSGVVTKRFVDVGAFIPAATSGSAAQTAAVVQLMNFVTVRVQVAVPEAEASLVSKGQPSRVTVTGLPARLFEGKIARFSYALDDSSKTMLAEIEVPNPDLVLRPGMYASVRLALEQHVNSLLMPTSALVMERVNAFAFVAEGTVARKRAIKIGFNDGANVEILEGLTPDDRVIFAGNRSLVDGQEIQISEAR